MKCETQWADDTENDEHRCMLSWPHFGRRHVCSCGSRSDDVQGE